MPNVTVTMPAELLSALDRVAERERRSRSNMLALLLEEALKRREDPTPEKRPST
jgi:metal-responsive CopG/Arc/MetJ family transcriptional regulator